MSIDLLRGFTTWGPQFGIAGIAAGITNALLAWLGERKKWLREMKRAEWEVLIPIAESAVNSAMRMPRRQLDQYQRQRHFSSLQDQLSGADQALADAQALHKEANEQVERLYTQFNNTILIFPQLHASGAVGAHGNFRIWFHSVGDEKSSQECLRARESGGRMIAALRRAAYEDLAINLSLWQGLSRSSRYLKQYFGSGYPDHLGKAM